MHVLVSVPNTGMIHKRVASVLLRLVPDKRYDIKIIMPTHVPYENNLHHIVNDFMDGDFDFWLNIDSDNPPLKNPLDLIVFNKDVIGLPTPVWHYVGTRAYERPIYENAYRYVPSLDAYAEWQAKEGLQRVDAVGTGCVLIARRVFEDPLMRLAPFARTLRHDGTVEKGNDIAFCERARAQGFEIYAHYDYRCQHFNVLELHEVGKAFYDLYGGRIDG